jgi:hypothetical protein
MPFSVLKSGRRPLGTTEVTGFILLPSPAEVMMHFETKFFAVMRWAIIHTES